MPNNIHFFFRRTDTPDFVIPFHTHKCYELIYYFSGKGLCYIDGKKFAYETGSCVVVPPNAPHNDMHNEESSMVCIGFTIGPDSGDLPALVHSDKSGSIGPLLDRIDAEITKKPDNFVGAVNALLEIILIELRRGDNRPARTPAQRAGLENAIRYIDEYYLTDISVQQLADMSNYSYHRFRHIFQQQMGVSPKQYLVSKRLDYAKTLLADNRDSITDICYKCGFSSTSFFIRQFKIKTDVTPLQYRKMLHSQVLFSEKQTQYESPSDISAPENVSPQNAIN